MERVAALIGGELGAHAQAAVIAHLHRCPSCAAELGQISWLARTLQTTREIEVAPETPHLTDLEVAALVTNSLRGAQAAYLEAHVARCAQCARLVASVRQALDEFAELFAEDLPPPPGPSWAEIVQDVRAALTHFRSAAALLAALLLYLAQCVLFSVPVAQIAIALLGSQTFFEVTPAGEPWAWVPADLPRLAVYWGVCVAGGLLAGRAARALYRWAVRFPARSGGDR
jgi:anti-sigma factor RsiW